MAILYVLIPLGLLLLGLAVWALFWAIKSGQYEDLEGPAFRILMDDDERPSRSAKAKGEETGERREG